MKRILAILLASFLLTGCTQERPSLAVPTDPAPTSGQTVLPIPTSPVNSGFSGQAVQWGQYPEMAGIPNPGEDIHWEVQWYAEPGVCALGSRDLDPDSYMELVDLFQEAGFTLDAQLSPVDSPYTQQVHRILFNARHPDGRYLYLRLNPFQFIDAERSWVAYLGIYRMPQEEVPEDALPTQESWHSDSIRALVPAPENLYWSGGAGEGGKVATVALPYMDMDAVQAYAQQLRSSGFVHFGYREISGGFFRYMAQDGEGNTVDLFCDGDASQKVQLRIYPAGGFSGSLWTSCSDVTGNIPQPPSDWFIYQTYQVTEIYLPGLDFRGAQDYIAACETFAGSRDLVLTKLVKTQEGEHFRCRLSLGEDMRTFVSTLDAFYIEYDPADGDCPCKLSWPYRR